MIRLAPWLVLLLCLPAKAQPVGPLLQTVWIVTRQGKEIGRERVTEWVEKGERPPLPGETLKRTLDEIVEKRAELKQRIRELEAELDTDSPPLPPEGPDSIRFPPVVPRGVVPDSFF